MQPKIKAGFIPLNGFSDVEPLTAAMHSQWKIGRKMDYAQLADWANLALTWIGFGTVVGLTAKAIMPGRDPGGPIATLMMGIAGTLIGCALLKFFYPGQMIQPITLEGFAVGAGGAFILLMFYKVLGGYWFTEGEQVSQRSRRRRKRFNAVYDD